MEYYKLRMDCNHVSIADCKDVVMKHINSDYAYCIEGYKTENPHMHWYFGTLSKQATMRKHLRELGLSGNGGYSLKSCDKDPIELLAYMMKERKYNFKGLPDDLVARVEAHDEEVKKSIREKKDNKKTVLQKIVELYEERMRSRTESDTVVYDELTSCDVILDYHRDNNVLVRKFQLQAYRDTLRVKYNDRNLYDLFQ